MMSPIVFITLYLLCQCEGAHEKTVEYLDTREFTHGFYITTVCPVDKPNILGKIAFTPVPFSGEEPQWRLAQWGSKYPLQAGTFEKEDETTWLVKNEGKKVILVRNKDGWDIHLNCNGIVEYQGKLRKYGEPWPHLLIEKTFPDGIQITKTHLFFNLDFRIIYCTCDPSLKNLIDPSLHTAQITAYWTVKNVNSDSKDYREFFWFGLPLFDVRYPIPPEYIQQDTGSLYTTNKLIAVMDGKRFYKGNTGDGDWKQLQVYLNPLLEEALNKGQEHGYLKNSKIEDFVLTSFNLGWEITGPYNAEIELKNLSLKCKCD